MSGKHKNWHKAWRRERDRIVHVSGAAFIIERGDGYTDVKAAPETLDEFQRYELARGVPLHDLRARLMRLAREAGEWLERNP